jgi:hypothetical protein
MRGARPFSIPIRRLCRERRRGILPRPKFAPQFGVLTPQLIQFSQRNGELMSNALHRGLWHRWLAERQPRHLWR